MKRLLILLPLLMLCLFYEVDDAAACSGGGGPVSLLNNAPHNEVVVFGTIVESSAGNAIIDVQSYLLGEGERYLLIYESRPGNWIAKTIRHYDFGCRYFGYYASVGQQVYVGLNRNDNGTYSVNHDGFYFMQSVEFNDDSEYIVNYQRYDGEVGDGALDFNRVETHTASISEFNLMVEQFTGQAPTPPTINNADYPSNEPRLHSRVLNITSQNGTQYVLPVDLRSAFQVTSSCTDRCPIYSPDYSHALYPVPENPNTFVLWYASFYPPEFGQATIYDDYIAPSFSADAVLFSPDSSLLLSWLGDEIIGYDLHTETMTTRGYLPQINEIFRVHLTTSEEYSAESLYGLGAWSGNSRVIAFWDADGLKLLDLLSLTEPRLLVESELIPPELELSQSGRYVRFGDHQEWILLDTVSDVAQNNTLVSPDETYFVQFRESTEDEELMETSFNQVMAVSSGSEIVDWYWLSSDRLQAIICENGDRNQCRIYGYYHNDRYMDYSFPLQMLTLEPLRQVVYDEIFDKFVMQFGDYTIIRDDPRIIDLTNIIDSPIAHIEWGEPLWYVEQ